MVRSHLGRSEITPSLGDKREIPYLYTMARGKNGIAAHEEQQHEKAPYLTKRLLVSAAAKGFKKASAEAMQLMGYIVIANEGWVVKKYADGRIEKISPIDQVIHRNAIALD